MNARLISIALAGILLASLGMTSNAELYIVLKTGDKIPDGTTNTLAVIEIPRMNSAGDLAFQATTFANAGFDHRIFRVKSGTLEQVARRGQVSPDINGNISDFEDDLPRLAGNGDVAFWATHTGTLAGFGDDAALYLFRGGELNLIAREGHPLPDGNKPQNPLFESVRASEDGAVLFISDLESTNRRTVLNALYLYKDGHLKQIATPGTPLLIEGKGARTVDLFGVDDAVFLPNGHVLFSATISPGTGWRGVFRFDGSEIKTVFTALGLLPDNSQIFGIAELRNMGFNSKGEIAFQALLSQTPNGTSDRAAILKVLDQNVTVLARQGQLVPGNNGRFLDFPAAAGVSMNEKGQVAFFAVLSGTAQNTADNAAMYVSDGATLREVVRKGTPAPDGNGKFDQFTTPTINAAGQVLFQALLTGSKAGNADDIGLFRAEPDGSLTTIAREGQTVLGYKITQIPVVDRFSRPPIVYGQDLGGASSIDASGNVVLRAFLQNIGWAILLYSRPNLTTVKVLPDSVEMNFLSVAGVTNYVQAASTIDINGGSFTNLSAPIVEQGIGLIRSRFVENAALRRGSRFYRVVRGN